MRMIRSIVLSLPILFVLLAPPARADMLTGTVRLACEAILCLSSGVQPGECGPSLDHYFGINLKTWGATQAARLAFLSLCPAGSALGMQDRMESIVDGAGKCDAKLLNRTLTRFIVVLECDDDGQYWNRDEERCREVTIRVVDDKLPNYCKSYINHEWSWKLGVRYVGDKMNGGKWVDEQ